MPNPISLFRSFLAQKPAPIGISDVSLPTFGGITGVTPNSDGSFTVTWAFGSSTKQPLRYEVYVKKGVVSASTLFSTDDNTVQITPYHINSTRVFLEADNATYFVKDEIYTFGVKAVDAFGFEGGPATALTVTAIASGNFPVVFQSMLNQFNALNTVYDGLNDDHNTLNLAQAQTQNDIELTVNQLELVAANLSATVPSYVSGKVESTSEVIGLVESIELASA